MVLIRHASLTRCLSRVLIRFRLSFTTPVSPAVNLVFPVFYPRRCFSGNVQARGIHDSNKPGHTNIISSQSKELKLVKDKSFPEFLFEKFNLFGNKRAIVDAVTGKEYSYPQIQELVVKCGSALTKLGFRKGDVCALYCPNVSEFPIIYLAILALGGIATTVSSLATLPELCTQMKDSKAKFIITVPLFATNAKEAARQCGMKEVIVVGEAEGCRPLTQFFQDDGCSFPNDIEINPIEDVAVMPYSSGTTGLPKGVMLTHFNLSSNVLQISSKDHYVCAPEDNILGLLPFFHIFGLNVVQGISLYSGAAIISLPKFEDQIFLQTVDKFKVSNAFVAPPLILFIAKSPLVKKYDLSSIRDVVCGAAPLSKELAEMASERLKGLKHIRQGYGLTETSPAAFFVPFAKYKSGSSGTLLPNTQAKVIDLDTGETLGENEKGEICLRGPQVMKGYLNNPQATNEAIDSDGWFQTGDIGYYDNDHFFYVVDRCKELIKYKGYQVAPGELEAVLTAHAKIQDAAVIGIPDKENGEVPKAFIVASGITKEEVKTYIEHIVAPYKKLRGGIEFVDEIPKSSSGKILRRVLKDKEMSVD